MSTFCVNFMNVSKTADFSKHGTLNDELPNRIISGTLQVKPNIREFTQTGIIWEDGTKTESVHNVIFATGYLFNLDIVENGALIPVKDNYTDLYKYIYPVKLLDHFTLGIVGLVQVLV
jgi:dimethylaniline monooxygenase (N-oxide forming)